GGHKQLLKKGAVNSGGDLVVKTRPSRNTSYLATYAGEAAWKSDTSGSVAVTVAGRWSGKVIGGYATASACPSSVGIARRERASRIQGDTGSTRRVRSLCTSSTAAGK